MYIKNESQCATSSDHFVWFAAINYIVSWNSEKTIYMDKKRDIHQNASNEMWMICGAKNHTDQTMSILFLTEINRISFDSQDLFSAGVYEINVKWKTGFSYIKSSLLCNKSELTWSWTYAVWVSLRTRLCSIWYRFPFISFIILTLKFTSKRKRHGPMGKCQSFNEDAYCVCRCLLWWIDDFIAPQCRFFLLHLYNYIYQFRLSHVLHVHIYFCKFISEELYSVHVKNRWIQK